MVQLSASASTEVLRLRAKMHQAGAALRISATSSNCLDFSYSLTFEADSELGDQVYQNDNIVVIVSSKALPCLNGLVLDYSEDLMGGGFRFHNPNAVQSCSCGNSFSIQSTS